MWPHVSVRSATCISLTLGRRGCAWDRRSAGGPLGRWPPLLRAAAATGSVAAAAVVERNGVLHASVGLVHGRLSFPIRVSKQRRRLWRIGAGAAQLLSVVEQKRRSRNMRRRPCRGEKRDYGRTTVASVSPFYVARVSPFAHVPFTRSSLLQSAATVPLPYPPFRLALPFATTQAPSLPPPLRTERCERW